MVLASVCDVYVSIHSLLCVYACASVSVSNMDCRLIFIIELNLICT